MLGEALSNEETLAGALRKYNSNTVQRGKQLYQRSREAAMFFAPVNCVPVSPLTLLEDALGRKLEDTVNVSSSSEGKQSPVRLLRRAISGRSRSSKE